MPGLSKEKLVEMLNHLPSTTRVSPFIVQSLGSRQDVGLDLQNSMEVVIDFFDSGNVGVDQVGRREIPVVKPCCNIIEGDIEKGGNGGVFWWPNMVNQILDVAMHPLTESGHTREPSHGHLRAGVVQQGGIIQSKAKTTHHPESCHKPSTDK